MVSKKARKRQELLRAATRRKLIGAIGAAFTAFFVALLTTKVLSIVDGLDWIAWPVLIVAISAAVAWLLLRFPSRGARSITAGVTVLALVVGGVWWTSNATRRDVEEMLAAVCSDGMWIDHRATCYPRSGDYIIENFQAFDPAEWHSWDEVSSPTVLSLEDVSVQAVALQGQPVASVGHVIVTQPLSGFMQTIQVQTMSSEESTAFSRSADAPMLFPDRLDRDRLSAGARKTDGPPERLVYCNLPARPFFLPRQGDLVAFTGVVIATGTTGIQGSGGVSQATYVSCSAAEVVGRE